MIRKPASGLDVLFATAIAPSVKVDFSSAVVLGVNEAARGFFGISRMEPGSLRLQDIFVSDDALERLPAELEGGTEATVRVTAKAWPGRRFYCVATLSGDSEEPMAGYLTVVNGNPAELLASNSSRLHIALAQLGGYLWEWDAVRGDTWLSPALKRLGGFGEAEEVSVEAWRALVDPEGREALRRSTEALIAGKSDEHLVEYRLTAKDGTNHWVRSIGRALRDRQGRLLRLIGFDQLVTTEKEQERRLRELLEQRAKMQFIVDHGPAVVFSWAPDANWTVTFVSDNVESWGYSAERLKANDPAFAEIVDPRDKARVAEEVAHYSAIGQDDFVQTYRILTADGSVRDIHDATHIWRDRDGTILEYQGIVLDVTDQREAERGLERVNRALEASLRAITEISRAGPRRTAIFRAACDGLSRDERYRMAWIGCGSLDGRRQVEILAHQGVAKRFIEEIEVTWKEGDSHSQGPTGQAILKQRPVLLSEVRPQDYAEDWQDPLQRWRIRSAISIPFRIQDDRRPYVLSIYSDDEEAFREREGKVLERLVADLVETLDRHRLASALRGAEEDRDAALEQLNRALRSSVDALANTVEIRDPYTAGHQRNVAVLAKCLAERMGLAPERIEGLEFASRLHDVGKLSVPSEILNLPRRLTEDEMEIAREHVAAGARIVSGIDFPWPVERIVLEHHERLDGSGYPRGLKGEDLLQESQILAVADVFEAMTAHRPYRRAQAREAALEELRQGKGRLYDAAAVEALEALLAEEETSGL